MHPSTTIDGLRSSTHARVNRCAPPRPLRALGAGLLLLGWLALAGAGAGAWAEEAEPAGAGGAAAEKGDDGATDDQPPPYLVALDFASDFDGGALGKQVGFMLRKKSARRRLYIVDAEVDWPTRATLMERPPLTFGAPILADPAAAVEPVTVETTAAKARAVYGCDVLIWGILERPDPKKRNLLLHVRALDAHPVRAPGDPAASRAAPSLIHAKTYRLGSNFEISQALDEVLKALTGAPTRADRAAADPAHRQRAVGPNLCAGGEILADRAAMEAAGWSFPMAEGIAILDASDAPTPGPGPKTDAATKPAGRVLVYRLSKQVAATTGLFCYTPYVPIEPGTYYQVSVRMRTTGPKVILFCKQYKDLEVRGYQETATLRQEVGRHTVHDHGPPDRWRVLRTRPFLPKAAKAKHAPEFFRAQLYAYHPHGKVWFDEVTIRACAPIDATDATDATSATDATNATEATDATDEKGPSAPALEATPDSKPRPETDAAPGATLRAEPEPPAAVPMAMEKDEAP